VHWALPFAIRVATGQAAMGLIRCFFLGKRILYLNELANATLHVTLGRIDTFHFEKLKLIIWSCHSLYL
jgi:hypothetical protein